MTFPFKIIAISFLIICAACTHPSGKNAEDSGFASVDLESETSNEKVRPLINLDSVRDQSNNNQESGKAQKIIGLVFGPGINRTIGYVSVLKKINEAQIPFHVVSGSGLGALLATYIALGESHNKIEWDFFQLIKLLKDKKPYSKEWIETVDDKILKNFKGKKIQSLKRQLLIPLYDTRKNEVTFFYRGDLYLALKYNLELVSTQQDQKYLSALIGSPYSLENSDKFGVDSWIGFDVLGDKLNFDRMGDDYLVGVLGKIISGRKNDSLRYRKFYLLPIADMPLDSVENMSRYLKYSENWADEIIDELKELTITQE